MSWCGCGPDLPEGSHGLTDGVVVLMAEVLAAMHGRVKRLETRYKVTPRGNGTWDVETEPELVQGTRPVAVEPTPSGASDYLWEGVANNVLPAPSGASKDLWGPVADKVMPVPMPGQQYNRPKEVHGLPAARAMPAQGPAKASAWVPKQAWNGSTRETPVGKGPARQPFRSR